jgi:tetratricopeptide (TPR) repeat protein
MTTGGVTTIDLHPEEMLDAARRGTLSARAEADLRAHLGRCAACRLTLSLPDDLRAEAPGTTADAALLARMVRGALAEEPRATYATPGRGRRVAIAVALLLVGGSGGAAVWASRDTIAHRFMPQIIELVRARGHVRVTPPAPRASVAAPATTVAPAVVAPAVAAPVVAAADVALAAPAHASHARVLARADRADASAEALFGAANRARRAGDTATAMRGYAELGHAYPGTREEITSRVVVGDLRLGQGAARDALASFDSYLAASPDGTLAEEARVGRALALQRLGRRDEEREAWTQLLRLHPDSVQGARARGRLAQLK